MGYTTNFTGQFELDKPLNKNMLNFLTKFNNTRRMKRDNSKLLNATKIHSFQWLKENEIEGEFFVDGTGNMGQDDDSSVLDYNNPPLTQPGLWCKWKPNEIGTCIEWDGNEKFYDYIEWIEYIIHNFLKPFNYELNGEVAWQGEESEDIGKINIKNNYINIFKGVIKYQIPKQIKTEKTNYFDIIITKMEKILDYYNKNADFSFKINQNISIEIIPTSYNTHYNFIINYDNVDDIPNYILNNNDSELIILIFIKEEYPNKYQEFIDKIDELYLNIL